MKRILIILAILIANTSLAQTDFKELYQSLSGNDRFSNLMNLKNYQGKYPHQAVPYFLIAEYYSSYMEESDPLTMFPFIKSSFYESKINYELARIKLDEQQARHDREYFGEIEIISGKRRAQSEDIQAEITLRIDSLQHYFSFAEKVYTSYNHCVSKYNDCLFNFRNILRNYPDYKEMFLLADPNLITDIERLSIDFDSSLIYFDSYKKSCARLPHLLSVNDYLLKPIITYRLEGLVETDFSLAVVPLWDYKSWSAGFLKTWHEEIGFIRSEMEATDQRIDQQIKELKESGLYGDEITLILPEDKFMNLIGKYDHASLANELFHYKKSKIRFLDQTRKTINDPSSVKEEYLINRLIFFKDLAYLKEELNREAEQLKQSVSLDDIGKYFSFFNSRYRGMDGLTRWCEVEKFDNDQILKKNLLHLEQFVENYQSRYHFRDSVLVYNNYLIAYGIQQPPSDSLNTDTLIVTHFSPFKKKQVFLSGYISDTSPMKSSFLVKAGKEGKVEWMHKPDFSFAKPSFSSFPVFNQLLDDSSCVTLHHLAPLIHAGSERPLSVIEIVSWDKKIVHQIRHLNEGFPCYFYADEINRQYLIITRGTKNGNTTATTDTLTITLTGFDGNTLWKRNYLLKGSFVDVVFSNTNIIICCNYNQFDDLNGNQISSSGVGRSDVLTLFLNREGILADIFTFSLQADIRIDLFEKLTSNLIHYSGTLIQDKPPVKKDVFYFLTDIEGKPVFSTEKEIKHLQMGF